MDISKRTLKNGKSTLIIKDADIIWLNFSGVERPNNRAGERNFCVAFKKRGGEFTDHVSEWCDELAREGWNIKVKDYSQQNSSSMSYEPGVDYNVEDLLIFMPVKVSYDHIPPKVAHKVGEDGNAIADTEQTISELDFAEIENVMLEINPSEWTVNGKSGIKAYLKTAFITIAPSPFGDFDMPLAQDDPDDLPF